MVSGAIKSAQVTASSSLAPSYGPGMARLNSLSAWCANNAQAGQYIQVRRRVNGICSFFVCKKGYFQRHYQTSRSQLKTGQAKEYFEELLGVSKCDETLARVF